MTVLREGELTLTLPDGVSGRQFDEARGMSHMHAVDWIIAWPRQAFFVEVKDPASGQARWHRDREKFVQRLKSSALIPNLVRKFRDSFLYEWACERPLDHISYFVILAGIDEPLLLSQSDRLRGELPVGHQKPWRRPLAHRCAVFNVDSWNREFPELQLTRDPQQVPGRSP